MMVVVATAVACIIGALIPAAVAGTGGTISADHSSVNRSAGNWTDAAAMPSARQGPGAALLPDGTVLVVGGRTSATDSAATSSTSRFTRSGSWRSAGQVRPQLAYISCTHEEKEP